MNIVRKLLADHRVRVLLVIVALVGGYFVVKAALPEFDLQDLLDDVADALGEWTYLVVGVFAFAETGAFVGLVLPGETVVILAGAVAGVGETSVVLTLAIVWFFAWAGDSVSFLLGRRLGRDFILRHGARVRITPERFARVEGYFERHGGTTILVGRFIGLIRALAPFVAGSSGMRYGAFVPYSILGTGLWSATFVLLGYFASRSLDTAAEVAGRGTLLFGITIGVIVGIVVTIRFLRVEENRDRVVAEMQKRPWLRPLLTVGRWIRPQAVFFWNRITPGRLGLELTTLIAALAVGLFVVIGYAITIHADPGPTGADDAAIEFVQKIQSGWLTDIAKAVTELGAPYVAFPIAAVGAIILAARRRFVDAGVVVVGSVLMAIAVPELKELLDRPRPPDPLIATPPSDAYPSGHAAYSVIYVTLAVLVGRQLDPRLHVRRITRGTALVLVGVLVAVAVGLSRVYLGIHYLSDVNGGWGLGVAAFALCGAIALVVTHLRKNGEDGGGRVEDSS